MPPVKLTYHMIRDGVVVGALSRALVTCGLCEARTCGIHVTSVEGVDISKAPGAVLFAQVMARPSRDRQIGIGCGCYAKAHRQLAHIKHRGPDKAVY